MGNTKYLVLSGQQPQLFTNRKTDPAANALVYFIKYKVGISSACASTFFNASIIRAVSPPDAILTIGFKPSPGLGRSGIPSG